MNTLETHPRADISPASKSGLGFPRNCANPGISPFDGIEWERRSAEITDDNGKAMFRQENVEVPKDWSVLATKIAVAKYFYGDATVGDDPSAGGREHSVRQLIHRVTRTIADLGARGWLFRGRRKRGKFLRRSHLALPAPIRRFQFPGVVQRRPLSPIRHQRNQRGGELVLERRGRKGPPRARAVSLSAGERLFRMDCDTTGIEPDIALVKYKLLASGGMLKIVNQTVPPALRRLGYSADQIAAVLQHIEKWDTIEDVTDDAGEIIPSGLKAEHLPVFDCAFRAHKGSRSLHYRGHLLMMAAAQPFLSGAISKTVNLPENASVEDIMRTYIEAWQLGLKAVAIYRDGSKRSAPLNTKKTTGMGGGNDHVVEDFAAKIASLSRENEALQTQLDSRLRRTMSDTRMSLTHRFEIAGHEGYTTVGLYPDGQPGELFVQMSKEGRTIGGPMDTVATLTSIALQYGVPLEPMVKKSAYQRFEPSGFTSNPEIRTAYSISDYVFRWMGCQFIDGYRKATSPDFNQVDLPMPEIPEMEKRAINRPVRELSVADHSQPGSARVQTTLGTAYMGITCSNCGSDKVIRAGACGVCTQCGTSQGCS
jgi:ribonucleoside-diphosphate reductase alpha chain